MTATNRQADQEKTPADPSSRGSGGRRILVPMDGSAVAEMALPHAVALARATQSGLTLLGVVPPYTQPVDPEEVVRLGLEEFWTPYEEQPEFAWHYFQKVAERLALTDVHVDTHVSEGAPAEMIVKYAQEHPDVAGIIMSTHGRDGVGDLIFGSVAENVLHSSPVPLLLARPESTKSEAPDLAVGRRYETLLAPFDGSPLARQAIDQAQLLARAVDARLVLLSVSSKPLDLKLVRRGAATEWSAMPRNMPDAQLVNDLDGIVEELATSGVRVEAQFTYGDIADEILKLAALVEADIIVMSK